MKKFIVLLLAFFSVMLMTSTSLAKISRRIEPEFWHEDYQRSKELFQTYTEVHQYVPNNITPLSKGTKCPYKGGKSMCIMYTDGSGQYWAIITAAGDKAHVVFKKINGEWTPWVIFDRSPTGWEPREQTIYVSPGAKAFAQSQGKEDARTATDGTKQNPENKTNSDPCAQLQGAAKAMCAGVGKALPALGTIFK